MQRYDEGPWFWWRFAAPPPFAEAPLDTGRPTIALKAMLEMAGSCTLTFVVTHAPPVDIDQLFVETVPFDASDTAIRLIPFDFGALPAHRPRVRQCAVPATDCAGIGGLLFSGCTYAQPTGGSHRAREAGVREATQTSLEVLGGWQIRFFAAAPGSQRWLPVVLVLLAISVPTLAVIRFMRQQFSDTLVRCDGPAAVFLHTDVDIFRVFGGPAGIR